MGRIIQLGQAPRPPRLMIAVHAVTGVIGVGRANDDYTGFEGKAIDVTEQCITAVIGHAMLGAPEGTVVEMTGEVDGVMYRLTVEQVVEKAEEVQ